VDFSFSEGDRDFGDAIRAWLEQNLDRDWRAKYEPTTPEWIAFQRDWDQRLYAGGWGGVFWPKEYGGLGATLAQKVQFARVMAQYGAPEGLTKLAKRLLAPILMAYGTDVQKERHLPRILRGEESWSQGFSEPGAGSDLARLRTRGVIEDDVVRITGQKVWTSHSWYTDWCFALIRTDPDAPRHNGISLVLIPADAPGVDIRPVRQINRKSEFGEVFLNDVVLPLDHIVGPVNDGWRVAMSVLAYERGAEQAFARLGDAQPTFESTLRMLRERPELEQIMVAADVGRLQAGYFAIQINAMRLLGSQLDGGDPDELASLSRLQSAEAWRRTTVEQLQLVAPQILDRHEDAWPFMEDYLTSRSGTIAAGSSEIQRNIIARRVLRMGRGG
jgi:alkylation response protein AidB-like acyl-CoA dehydrogenase